MPLNQFESSQNLVVLYFSYLYLFFFNRKGRGILHFSTFFLNYFNKFMILTYNNCYRITIVCEIILGLILSPGIKILVFVVLWKCETLISTLQHNFTTSSLFCIPFFYDFSCHTFFCVLFYKLVN